MQHVEVEKLSLPQVLSIIIKTMKNFSPKNKIKRRI